MRTRGTAVAAAALCIALAAATGCAEPSGDGSAAPPDDAAACRAPAVTGTGTTLAAADRRAPAVAVGPGGLQVAAWESRTGGPVEAATREPGGPWSVTALGGSNAGSPVVAADRSGAVVAWEGFDDGSRIVFAAHGNSDRWESPQGLSRAGRRATEPAVTMAEGVRLVAWTEADPAAVVVAEAPAGDGTWHQVRIPTDEGAVSRIDLAPSSSGVVAMWLRDRPGGRVAEASVRERRGRWSAPVALTTAEGYASDAVLAGGAVAVAAWRVDVGKKAMEVRARVLHEGRWTDATTLARDVDRPLGIARSDALSVAPAAAAAPSGGQNAELATVTWPQRRSAPEGAVDEVVAAVWDGPRGWSQPRPVSRPPREQAGIPAVAVDGTGRIVLAWESLVGDRQTARIGVLSGIAATATECCTDLVPPGQEASAPRVAATPDDSAVAIWVGTNRGSIHTADVPIASTCG